MRKISTKKYKEFFIEIKRKIKAARYAALREVNNRLIALYWDVGRMIVERQKDYGWGKSVVNDLSKDLQREFPGLSGLSSQNLWRMRQFHLAYRNNKKLSPLVREIGWTHNIIILAKCESDLEREFYVRMTLKYGWSKNILTHQIENNAYVKTLTGQTNFKKTLPANIQSRAQLSFKDEYTFDFLNLSSEHNEAELEKAIVLKINKFLAEMKGIFAFMGNQYRVMAGGKEYFIDILLYHRKLKCLVAVELKVEEFKPEFVGKMQFYLSVLDDKVRTRDENPSIGIIVCKEKNRTIVEYALRQSRKPIGVVSYKITSRLPRHLKNELPSPKQISKLIEDI